jgi:signal transduction histidine kinase
MPYRHVSDDARDLLVLLRDIGTRFLEADDASSVAGEVFAALSRKLDLGVYLNYLVAEDGRSLRLSSYAGIDDAVARSLGTLEFGQAICGTVALTRERYIAEAVQTSAEPLVALAKALGVSTYACHPLIAGERLIGTLSFGSRSRDRFTAVELQLMQTVATFAAVAIDRATATQRHRRAQMLLTSAQEEERRRIARELHDEMAQRLTGMSLELKSLEYLVTGSREVSAKLQALQRLFDDIGRDVHRIARELRPTALDDLGLALALSTHVEEWSQRCGLTVDLHISGLERRAPAAVETAVYRIVQEALTNVVKHAHATRVSVIVSAFDHHLQVIVEDDGVGFDVDAASASVLSAEARLGLAGMEERAALLGGSVSIESAPGRGTSVFVRIPTGRKPAGLPERSARPNGVV